MDAAALLQRFEEHLQPSQPTAGAEPVDIVGYGEVSTVFRLAGLPGHVCKRMAGFRDAAAVQRYIDVVQRYIERLTVLGVPVAATVPVSVRTPVSGEVVYLLQPQLDGAGLGNHLLRTAGDGVLLAAIERVLAIARTLLLANRAARDGRAVTVDAQLSNWHFPVAGDSVGVPTLIDVGTPFMRLGGVDEMGIELFLAPVPALMRPLYRRLRLVERYIDDYFDPRTLLIDLLGNFHKEGRSDRIDLGVTCVNRWLGGPGAELDARPITRGAVDRYYRKDAQLLELFLKVRRLDRWVRTRLLRGRYNFILPGPIRR